MGEDYEWLGEDWVSEVYEDWVRSTVPMQAPAAVEAHIPQLERLADDLEARLLIYISLKIYINE